jgi:hypothetical protein
MRDFYTKIIMGAFNRLTLPELVNICVEYLNNLYSGRIEPKQLTLTKKVGDVADYKIRVFSDDDKKMQKRLESLDLYDPRVKFDIIRLILNKYIAKEDIEHYSSKHPLEYQTVQEYIMKALPGQVQLAEKLRNRGMRVDIGERLRFLIVDQSSKGLKGKVSEKLEELVYYMENSRYLKIDHNYYTSLAVNPMDEIFAIFQTSKDVNPFKKMYKARENYHKVVQQLKNLFSPKVVLLDK